MVPGEARRGHGAAVRGARLTACHPCRVRKGIPRRQGWTEKIRALSVCRYGPQAGMSRTGSASLGSRERRKDLHAKLASPAVLSGMPRTRGALHAEEPLPYRTEEALGHHGTQGWAPALDRWRLSYSTTFGVPETGRVPVRMKVSTRPKTRSLPQKCPRAMAARNSGRRSSKRRSRAGSRVIMSACMP